MARADDANEVPIGIYFDTNSKKQPTRAAEADQDLVVMSARKKANGSKKDVAASGKDTPCFLKLLTALPGSHVNDQLPTASLGECRSATG